MQQRSEDSDRSTGEGAFVLLNQLRGDSRLESIVQHQRNAAHQARSQARNQACATGSALAAFGESNTPVI